MGETIHGSNRSGGRPVGLEVRHVDPSGLAARLGVRPGDRLRAINHHSVRDEIDLFFYSSDPISTLSILTRTGRVRRWHFRPPLDEPLGIVPEPLKPLRCTNNCIFCFIDQNPPGLRHDLYVKDEDYRLSFTHGNYITGTRLSAGDLRRIVRQHLSPLYISVHATEPGVRRELLGRKWVPDIMRLLRYLHRHNIDFHTQLVICPGLNDGPHLERSIHDLLAFRPRLRSIALVPVGLTDHRRGLRPITPVDRAYARRFLDFVAPLQRWAEHEAGEAVVFCADEWFLTAGRPLPAYTHVPLHQMENGVGMVWHFLRPWVRRGRPRLRPLPRPWRVAALTSPLGFAALRKFWEEIGRVENLAIEPIVVENSLFGRLVTVTGLLPGRDFERAIVERHGEFDQFLIPGNALRETDDLFIDDLPFSELKRRSVHRFGVRIDFARGDALAIWRAISRGCASGGGS